MIGTNIKMELENVTRLYDQYNDNYTEYYYDDEPLYRLQDHVSSILNNSCLEDKIVIQEIYNMIMFFYVSFTFLIVQYQISVCFFMLKKYFCISHFRTQFLTEYFMLTNALLLKCLLTR